MDNLLFALWKDPDRRTGRPEDFWLDPPATGFGRLLVAVAIIGIAAGLLDHAAAKRNADTLVTASYGSSQQGSWK